VVILKLAFRPPYDFARVLAFLRARAIPRSRKDRCLQLFARGQNRKWGGHRQRQSHGWRAYAGTPGDWS
jgi:hypothetical protein